MASRILYAFLIIGFIQSQSVYSYEVLKLSCNQIHSFVDGHNYRRLQLAKGAIAGQPPASEMKYMMWDEELAAKAADWAGKSIEGHNPSRSVNSGRFNTGENIFWYTTYDTRYVFNPEEAMKAWFDEHKMYNYAPIDGNNFKTVGHYTQMAWSDSVYVGCAISRAVDGFLIKFKVVCNYGPAGNYIGQTPYETTGHPSGHLVCSLKDCSKPYGRSC